MKKIALQLYSLKDVIGTDVDGAFARLAAMDTTAWNSPVFMGWRPVK